MVQTMMSKKITCPGLAALMTSKSLYAVVDVRERGEFNDRQIANATSLPRSQIEFRIASLVPNRKIPIVVYDEGEERAELAVRTLTELGYSEVALLEGGLAAWDLEGGTVVSGVNVPSKTFGEKIYHERIIPELTAEELKRLQQDKVDLIVVDVRTPEEYGRFRIPGALNVPGGDLVLWADELKRKPVRMVVVNCAGRTRSIIGTAALHRLGVTQARALKNGTMGWVLAGFELESKRAGVAPIVPDHSGHQAPMLTQRLAQEEGISFVSGRDILGAVTDRADTVNYLIDVRSPNEYERGHIPGSLSVPGGQAVQRADDFIAVRNGGIIFISNEGSRAIMAAYWYRRMGFANVGVLLDGLAAWRSSGRPIAFGAAENEPLGLEAARTAVRLLAPLEAKSLLRTSSVVILDVGSSLEYEAAHIPGAKWISRGWLELRLPGHAPDKGQLILLSCPDGRHSIFAGRTLHEMGYEHGFAVEGGVQAWNAVGLPTETGTAGCLTETNDVVLSPSIKGDKEDMRRYLDWELRLVER
jgi:rhodanese-related sulfurtransferase